MSETVQRASLKIVQIVVEVAEGEYCAVALPAERMSIIVGFLEDLSEGPIKLVRLPGVTMQPFSPSPSPLSEGAD